MVSTTLTASMHTRTHETHTHVLAFKLLHTHTCSQAGIRTHSCTHPFTHTYAHTRRNTCAHTHMHTLKVTHTHAHRHRHTNSVPYAHPLPSYICGDSLCTPCLLLFQDIHVCNIYLIFIPVCSGLKIPAAQKKYRDCISNSLHASLF